MDNQRIYARPKEELINLGKKGKIKYYEDNFVYIGHCPMCNEIAYEQTNCVFCGCEFEEPTEEEIKAKKEANHEIEVTNGNVTLHQMGNSLFKRVDGKLISHSTLLKPYTKEELERLVKKI